MANNYYNFSTPFIPGTKVRSEQVNTQLGGVESGFDLMPTDPASNITGTAWFGTDVQGATVNDYNITTPDPQSSLANGQRVAFFATHTNDGPAAMDLDGLGANAMVNFNGTAFVGGEVVSGQWYEFVWDNANTQFIVAAAVDNALEKTYAQEWANNAVGVLVSSAAGGDQVDDYSALHWSVGSENWATRAEDDPIPTIFGGDGVTDFSAFHWAQKAQAATGLPTSTVDGEFVIGNAGAFDTGTAALLTWDPATGTLLMDGSPGTAEPSLDIINVDPSGIVMRMGGVGSASTNWEIFRSIDQSGSFSWSLIDDHGLSSANHRMYFQNQSGQKFLEFDNSDEIRIMGSESAEQLFLNNSGTFAVRNGATLYLEQTAVNANITGHGQLFVESSDDSLHYVTEAGVDFDLTAGGGDPSQLVDGSANVAVIAEGLGVSAVRSVGNIDSEGRELEWQLANGTTRFSIGNEFFTDMVLRNHIAGRHILFNVGTGGGSRIRLHLSGDASAGGASLYAGTSATPRLQSLNHGVEIGNGTLFLVEQAAQEADITGQGQLWVNSADDSLNYVTEAGLVMNLGQSIYNLGVIQATAVSTGLSMEAGKIIDFSASMQISEGVIDLNGIAAGLQIRGNDENDDGLVLEDGARVTWEDLAFANHVYLRNEGIGGGSGTLTMRTDSIASFVLAGPNMRWDNSTLTNPITASAATSPSRLGFSQPISAPNLYLTQQTGADTDVAGAAQLWVQDDVPNRLMFTDVSGNDHVVGMAGGFNSNNVNINNSFDFNSTDNRADNFISHHFDGGNDTITLEDSGSTVNWPLYSTITIIAPGSGNITVTEGSGTTLFDDAGQDTIGGVVINGGVVSITRQSSTNYIIWGSGYT